VLGVQRLLSGGDSDVFCLGSGRGFSVREVIAATERVTGLPVPVKEAGRRAGDAASLVCGSSKAMMELDWTPRRSDLETMIADACAWSGKPGFSE